MIRLLARLHGIQRPEKPNYGQDMATLAKGSTAIGLLTSGVVIAHLLALGSSGMFLFLRFGVGYTRRETLILTALALVALFAFALVGIVVWSSQHGKLVMRDRVIAGLNLQGDEQVLDVGCGNGLLLIGAAQQLTTGMATGVDIWRGDLQSRNSAESVLQNAKLAGVHDRVQVEDADAQQLPFEDNAFDVILTSFMLHHMTKTARENAISEMVRTLKPGGKLVIVEVHHIGEICALLEQCGAANIQRLPLHLPVYKRVQATKCAKPTL